MSVYYGGFMQRKIRIYIACMILVLSCLGCQKKQPVQELEEINPKKSEVSENKEKQQEEKNTIYVYVCGAVAHAGVYELKTDSRVYEAIEKAGGFTEDAAVSGINQAALLKDEEQIYVPFTGEAGNLNQEAGQSEAESGKVNLNTATKEELMTLAGIGESKADSIIRYREEKGKFQSIEDIKQIEGIKDGVFQKIKDLITV